MQAVSPAPDGCYPNYATAEGCDSLNSLTTGAGNTALGWRSLFFDSTGGFNTGVGAGALALNNGDSNTAAGAAALLLNTNGSSNTAVGTGALLFNVDSNSNTAVGDSALIENDVTGNGMANFNTAVGALALENNSDGEGNTGVGFQALNANTTGEFNVATGSSALAHNTVGHSNTAVGVGTLQANNTGSDNTAVGRSAGFSITGNGNVCIGEGVLGVAGENDTTRIRNIYDTIQPVVGTNPDEVTINSGGRLGRANVSSRRYKHDIQPMDKASEAIYALRPVSFRYNKEYDATQTLAFGLIAEDVAEVYPDLVGCNRDGQPESVRYKQINAMLLNEFLKEHRKVEKLEATVASLVAAVEEQATQIQEGNARLEVGESGPQKVADDR